VASEDDFESDGVFWLPDQPERRVAGRVTYRPDRHPHLELHGHFGSEAEVLRSGGGRVIGAEEPSQPRRTDRIVGVASRKLVTLDDCVHAGMRMESPGGLRESYVARQLILGAHFDADEPMTFTSVGAEIEGLQLWYGASGMTLQMEHQEGAAAPTRLLLDFRPPPIERYVMADGRELESGANWRLAGDHIQRSEITQGRFVRLRSPDLRTIDDLLPFASDLQDLLSIAADRAVDLEAVTLQHPDLVHEVEGRTVHESVTLLRRGRVLDIEDKKPLHVHSFSFGAQHIGGLAGLNAWLAIEWKHRAAISRLLSTRYSQKLSAENCLLNACSGAESLHRNMYPAASKRAERAVWLSARLAKFAEVAAGIHGAGIPEPERWAVVTARSRNALVHVDSAVDLVDEVGSGSLRVLADVVYFVSVATLLHESESLRPAAPLILGQQNALVALRSLPSVVEFVESVLDQEESDED
jgi:hypothetical protein